MGGWAWWYLAPQELNCSTPLGLQTAGLELLHHLPNLPQIEEGLAFRGEYPFAWNGSNIKQITEVLSLWLFLIFVCED